MGRTSKTLLVALICLSGAATGSYLLYQDFTAQGDAGQGAPLAKVEHRDARVRRKSASSYVWTKVNQNQDLYRRESIQTGEGSGAIVRLSDGSTLEMKENSLVIIDDVENLTTNFLQGSMVLHRDTGDSAVSVGDDGKAKVQELPVSLLKPEALSEIFFASSGAKSTAKDLMFSWKFKSGTRTPAEETQLKLQVSTDHKFPAARTENFRIDEKAAAASLLTAPLKAGHYFWRVVRDKEVLSGVGKFALVAGEALKPTWPGSSHKVQLYGDDGFVQFRWLDPRTDQAMDQIAAQQSTHELEVSADPQFKTTLATKVISAASGTSQLSGLPMGALFWRTKSKFGDIVLTSEIERFSLEQAKKLPIELIKPAVNAAVGDHGLRFSWSSEASSAGTEYVLELEKQNASGKGLTSEKTRASSHLIKEASPGIYRWRVQALADTHILGESEWRTLTIEAGSPLVLKLPVKNHEIWFWKEKTPFKFEWSSDPLVQHESQQHEDEYSYNLEISPNDLKDKDFKDREFKVLTATLKSKKNFVESSELKLPDGDYLWRIQIVNNAGQVVKTSEVSHFKYGTHPLLKFPAASHPPHGSSVNPLETEKDPVLSWTAVEGAEAYELTVTLKTAVQARAPASEKVLIKTVTKERSFELKNTTEGTYTWSVRAVDQLGRPGESLPGKILIVNPGAPLAAPEPLSKEVQ